MISKSRLNEKSEIFIGWLNDKPRPQVLAKELAIIEHPKFNCPFVTNDHYCLVKAKRQVCLNKRCEFEFSDVSFTSCLWLHIAGLFECKSCIYNLNRLCLRIGYHIHLWREGGCNDYVCDKDLNITNNDNLARLVFECMTKFGLSVSKFKKLGRMYRESKMEVKE